MELLMREFPENLLVWVFTWLCLKFGSFDEIAFIEIENNRKIHLYNNIMRIRQ